MDGSRSVSFIELKRHCPDKVRSQASSLYRFHLLIIEIGETSQIHLSQDLDYEALHPVVEINVIGGRSKTEFYFVLGSKTMHPNKLFDTVNQGMRYDGHKGVPSEVGKTYAVVLLNFPTIKEAELHRPQLTLERHTEPMIPGAVTDAQRYIIKDYLQDMLIYGSPCDLSVCNEFTSMLPRQNLDPIDNMYLPVPLPLQVAIASTEVHTYRSCNRCSATILPMQLDEFSEGAATPGKKNNCERMNAAVSKFQGVRLQSTAQMIVRNVLNFFEKYVHDLTKLPKKPANELTSDATLVSVRTIAKISQKVKGGLPLLTPSRKQTRVSPVMCQIDSFKAEMIRRIIRDAYSNNIAPLANDIYQQFMEKVAENERLRTSQGETDVKQFSCSVKTFRKILHSLGFRFGRINTRDAVLMRPDIVTWRGKYLTEMRRNRKSANPMKIIWLDGKICVINL